VSAVAVIGARERVRCFAFAGVHVLAAEDADAVRAAWQALPAEVELLMLTPAAREALGSELVGPGRPLHVVMAP